MREALHLHKTAGLWDRVMVEGKLKREWGNVSEHCLVEAARAEMFGELFRLSEPLRVDLMRAAALHDFFKRRSREIVKARGKTAESHDEAHAKATEVMRAENVSEQVIRIVNSVGYEGLHEAKNILAMREMSENDLACLIMHYIDNYTVENNWVVPASIRGKTRINDIDRRSEKSVSRYPEVGKQIAEQVPVDHAIEMHLSNLLAARGINVEPLKIPEYIDERLRERINL